MKRISELILTLCVLFLPGKLHAQMQVAGLDSAVTAAFDSKLNEYFAAMEALPASGKIEECDFILNSCPDSLLRQYAAVRIYDHFLGSKLMGDEAVAVHMVDDWFAPKRISMYSEVDLLNAQVFARFHRSSLIGMKAPELELLTPDGEKETLPVTGRPAILFFYDTSCSKCKLETLLLKPVLESIAFPMDFFAVYSGIYSEQWEDYRDTRWDVTSDNVAIHHLWDPELDSDFQMLYGVLQTPQLLLVDNTGRIVGRGLDSEALSKLLPSVAPDEYEYGAQESSALFDALFDGVAPSAAGILDLAQYIKEQALSKADSTLCRHMLGDFMFYLMDAPGEEYKLALNAFIGTYVDGDPKMWQDPAAYGAVVRPAAMMKELLGRIPYGSRIPKLKLEGVLVSGAGSKKEPKHYSLRRLRGSPSYLIFHSPGCSSCDELLSLIPGKVINEPGAKFLLVDPDRNEKELLDIFDLSALPFVLKMDKKGTVVGKYLIFE